MKRFGEKDAPQSPRASFRHINVTFISGPAGTLREEHGWQAAGGAGSSVVLEKIRMLICRCGPRSIGCQSFG